MRYFNADITKYNVQQANVKSLKVDYKTKFSTIFTFKKFNILTLYIIELKYHKEC